MWNCNATVKIYLLAVGWRPAFKFYSMWLSLVGAVVCIFVMFIISWPTALITMAVIAVLFFYVHYRKPGLSLPLPVFAQVLFSPVFVCYSAPDRGVEYCDERVCLCLCVCLPRSCLRVWSSPNFLCMLPMAVAQSCFGGLVICYIFSVLWMTSYLHIIWGCSTSPPGWGREVHSQLWAWHVGIGVAGCGRSGLLLAVRAY